MIRTLDPQFPAALSRVAHELANLFPAQQEKATHHVEKPGRTERPKWDAPAHWIKPDSDW